MTTSAGMARAPFLATVGAKVCACKTPTKEVGRSATLDKAIRRIEGYWNVYLGFYGDQIVWMQFQVVDLRDGRVVWRNGRQLLKEDEVVDLDTQ